MSEVKDPEEVLAAAAPLAERAVQLRIESEDQHAIAAEMVREIVAARKSFAEWFDPIIESAHKSHKTAIEQKKRFDGPMERAERALRNELGRWHVAREDARRRAEAKAQAEALRVQAETRKAVVDALKASGQKDAAKAVAASTPVGLPPVVLPEAPVPQGVTYRTSWDFDVVDEAKIPREYLTVDLVKIGKVVRAMKGKTNIPGIAVKETPMTTVKA